MRHPIITYVRKIGREMAYCHEVWDVTGQFKNKKFGPLNFQQQSKDLNMPSDESRRLLKAFGVAVSNFEDAVHRNDAHDEIIQAEAIVRARLEELSAWIERLRRHAAAA
jgi:hypothetical protein